MSFYGDGEANVAQADYAQGVVAGVVGDGGDVIMGLGPALGGAGACSKGGGCHVPEYGDDVVDGGVSDGFSRGAAAVAVDDAWIECWVSVLRLVRRCLLGE